MTEFGTVLNSSLPRTQDRAGHFVWASQPQQQPGQAGQISPKKTGQTGKVLVGFQNLLKKMAKSQVFVFAVHQRPNPMKTWCMGPNAGVDLTLCSLQNRLLHIYHGQPYAGVDLNPMPESTLFPSQGLWIWPQDISSEI